MIDHDHWEDVIPLTLDLPTGTAVTSKHLGKGIVIDTKPMKYGWPHDAYVLWFVVGEGQIWKCSPRAEVYLDLESHAGFAYGLRLLVDRYPDDPITDYRGPLAVNHLYGETSDADRLTLARALAKVTS